MRGDRGVVSVKLPFQSLVLQLKQVFQVFLALKLTLVMHWRRRTSRREPKLLTLALPLQVRHESLAALAHRAARLLNLPVELLDFEFIDDAVLSLVHHLSFDFFLNPLGPEGVKSRIRCHFYNIL